MFYPLFVLADRDRQEQLKTHDGDWCVNLTHIWGLCVRLRIVRHFLQPEVWSALRCGPPLSNSSYPSRRYGMAIPGRCNVSVKKGGKAARSACLVGEAQLATG